MTDYLETVKICFLIKYVLRFLTGLHESCYHMMGSLGPSLGRDLYNIPDLGLAIVNSVLSCMQVSKK